LQLKPPRTYIASMTPPKAPDGSGRPRRRREEEKQRVAKRRKPSKDKTPSKSETDESQQDQAAGESPGKFWEDWEVTSDEDIWRDTVPLSRKAQLDRS